MTLASIPEILEEISAGRMFILVDDPGRENEGDLVIAAEQVTPEAINFMRKLGGGLVCLAVSGEIADRLALTPQAPTNESRMGTAFTVSIDAREGTTTGISAADRALTIRKAVAKGARPEDFVRPGHVLPLRARDGGVLVRAGQTEGAVDLARLAGRVPAGVICEIMRDDGSMARMPDLERFAAEHGLKICTVADIIQFRSRNERLVDRESSVKLPTRFGVFDLHVYTSTVDPSPQVALTMGLSVPEKDGPSDPIDEPLLVRVHSECMTGDIFGSLRCDCGEQKEKALQAIGRERRGVFLYMRQEGRGIGLRNKMRAYKLQQSHGLDTVEANTRLGFKPDERDYGVGAQILSDLGVRKMKLLTNNPKKFKALNGYGLEIVERVPLTTCPREENVLYLRTKKEKLGHLLPDL
jgi:3,4-dihydroxy 2-butanone 4-phosphate synthase/GTP cyclohydrolase II